MYKIGWRERAVDASLSRSRSFQHPTRYGRWPSFLTEVSKVGAMVSVGAVLIFAALVLGRHCSSLRGAPDSPPYVPPDVKRCQVQMQESNYNGSSGSLQKRIPTWQTSKKSQSLCVCYEKTINFKEKFNTRITLPVEVNDEISEVNQYLNFDETNESHGNDDDSLLLQKLNQSNQNKTLLSKLDAGVIKMLKLWLGLALTADSSALFRDRNSFGMNLKRPSELYKHLRVSKRHILGKSHDDVVTSLPKDNDAPELESRLQFHKQFMIGAQNNRVGLGSSRKVQDTDILKTFIRQDENDKYKIHAMSLEMQNEWLDIGDFCIPLALKWRTLIHDWSPALLKFYLNAFQMTLPDQSNLVRWGKGTEKTCYICGKAVGTAKHLLVGCKVLLDSGQYSRRHDRVLEIIRFVREGTRAIKSNVKPYSILKAASDWTIMMDTYEKQYKIPEDICASASRPDIFLYSRILKRVVMIELTVPWETNIPKDHATKVNKYYELTNELTRNRFVVDLYAVEVGARGITAKSLYNLLKDLGLSRTNINSFLERTSKAALVGSFQIWLGRERNLDSGGERITRVIREGGRKICPPVDLNGENGANTDLKCPTCGKNYKRRAWYIKHLKTHNGVEARQSLVSSSIITSDRVDPHVSHGEPLTGNHQESINIRTRLSIPNMKQSTWKVHDDNLAVLLEHPGSKQELNSQVETFQNTVYDYFNEQYPPPKALGDNHLSHQLARALRSILKLIQGISAQTAEYRGNFDRAKQEVDFDKNPFEYSKTIFKKERGQLLLTNDQIYDHFKSTYEVPKSVRLYTDPNEQKPEIPHIDFHGIPPTLDEISSHIKRKSSKSAPGPDGIPYIVFKKCPSVRKHLINIYGKIWSRKQIPECFGKAMFVLIPKKDRVTDPKDTRPIALTNTISKIFFSVLQTRMTRFMLSNKYFRPNHQKGFLPGISGCLEHNTLLSESLKDARKSERQITVCWIDLENAFGSIQHELMLFALRWYNFPPLVRDMIASYYSKLRFSIITKEGPSKSLSYNVGLFQGCCLSPIVFNIVINILVDKLISNEKKWGYRFKFNNKYTESILAFADDLAILTRHPKHCQVLLDEVDKFCEWTDGLRTKPSKCHCLCLGRRNTRYTSYDPGLSIGGQCVSTVTEDAPFKFLGRKIDNIGRTPSLEGIVDSFLNDLNKVDSQQISNVKKAWIYDNYFTSRLNWPFLVYDFSKTLLSKLDAGVIKMLKLWLGLALTADSSALFRDRNSFGMNLKRPSELYKHLRVSKRHILGKSHDDVVTSLPKDNDAPELESRLQFHKQFMIGAQNNRVGLGSSRKVQDTDILKSFIRQDENDKYKIHAMSLEMQNEWLDIGDFCIPLALKWRTLIHDWSPALLKFYLNAFQMTLPDQSNLVRWGKGTEKTCYICGKAVGTAKHLLVGCKVLLDSGQYSRRHDRVLEIIREAVSLSVARAQREITTNERSIGFVREGTRAIKSNVKPYSILKAASDWTIMMDTYEKQYKIPEDICASASRPDIFLYSRILKRVVMIELTVPWETNIPKDHATKVNKYYELTNELTRNRFVVDLYAVEVGARGITAKSLYNLLKDLGLSRTNINSFLERTSKAALLRGPLNLHLGRKSQALLKLLSLQRNGPGTRTVNPLNAKRYSCSVVDSSKYTCDDVKKLMKQNDERNVIWCSLVREDSVYLQNQRSKRSPDSRPELVYTFIEQAVQPGAQVALKCSAVGEPPPRFRWILDGLPIPAHHGAMVTEGRETGQSGLGSSNYILSTLSLNSARVEHGGRYECRATNTHGSVAHAARLNVYGPPYIRSINPVKAVAGSDITIWCPYYGFPIDSVKWEGGAGNDPRYHQSDGQLTISNVDRTRDKGGWICSVLTPGGELARREVQINVVSPPVLSPIVFPPGLRSGDRAQLTCTVTSGDMPVYFSWLKDQMPISSVLQVDERGAEFYSMLLFKSLTAAHSGIYTCVVTNTAGKANMSAELAIKVPPYWQLEPSDTSVLLNGSLTVSCEARGHPPPHIYWTKFTGSTESALGGVSDPVVLGNGSLRLDSARAEHSGKYRCKAENGVAPALSKTLTIHVNEPARFETPSVNVTAKLGETVRLVCVARGDNPLSMAWSHSGRTLPNSDYRMSISETRSVEGLRSELVIERADRRDSGVYRCQATNPYGRSDHFVHLGVQEPPEPPANFRVVDATSRTIRLQWRRPFDGNSPVLGYVVQYRRHDSTNPDMNPWRDADTHNVSVSARNADSYSENEEATITGLEPATAYLVRARTVTAQFSSAQTRALLALTLHEPPARPPLALRASAPRPSTIELAWQAPPASSWNGELLGYTVWWWLSADGTLSGGASVGMEFATVRGHVTKYTIAGLEHYTRYSVSVRAFNSAGAGPATPPVNTLTQESVPSEGPRAVRCRAVSPQSLKVEWSPPPAHAHHGALLGYKLLYRPEHTTGWVEWEARTGAGGAPETGAEVKRVAGVETLLLALRPHMNYTLQVLAYTASGDGVPAHPVHCTTQQDAPGPPAAVKVIATSVTSLAVSWLPPSRPNGPILYYTVFYRELGRDRPPQTTTVQAEEGEMSVGLGGYAEIRSLSETATYEAWVAAHSAAGEGEQSAPQPATTTSRAVRLLSFGVWARVQCGHPLRLACAWRGEPAPRARWLRGDRPVTHDPRTHLTPHGHLAIHEVDSSTIGNYTCSARNAFSSEEETYRVECASPPAAPTLTLEKVDHTLAKLSWRTTHHPSAPPHGFTIYWMRIRDESGEGSEATSSRGEDERRIEAGGEASSVVLRSLSCGGMYSVKAVAHSRAGSSSPSPPLLVRTKPPVLVWEGGGDTNQDEGAEAAVWSNSSALALDARRAVSCGARLVRLQWRRADTSRAWRDADLTSLHHHREVVIGGLTVGMWYALKLWTATDSGRQQTVIYAATTTHSGERLRRPASFLSSGPPVTPHTTADNSERVLGAVSLAFAALAALAVSALLIVLMAKRSTLLSCGGQVDEEARRCSHTSGDKTACPEQQNMRNCQHDYKHDKLSPASDVYEISPYATFAVGGETAATLDHTLQFRTFGHRENDAPPHRPCRKHPQRHRERTDASVEKHHSECELQHLRYEKVRPRHCPGTSYCMPLQHHGGGGSTGGGGSVGGFSEVYAGDSSVESGPGSLSPRTHHEHS
ncbi:unnamed protein product [Danaus chrysippus]|uniref:(African queen) hypothetical protein n=1 Tax=Danaus chrysippus TaxID=151541 RepID=A0A8J2QUF6_9NEOP|nr:unnamed protein product [Danaus chrysippus]